MVRQHYRRNVWLMVLAGMMMPINAAKIEARDALAQALTGQAGDPARGKAVAADARKGNCIICHAMPMPELSSDTFGNMGPSLAGIGSRLSAPQLRQRIADPRILSSATMMQPYFATTGLTRVQTAYVGNTLLSATAVERTVAYL